MKRKKLMKHLFKHGAILLREGKKHTIIQKDMLVTEVPRHKEIIDILAKKICKDLNIPFVR